MNLNIGIIIKGFLAISITLLIVIGIIRTSNNLFYVESINPPSKDELFANIDFISSADAYLSSITKEDTPTSSFNFFGSAFRRALEGFISATFFSGAIIDDTPKVIRCPEPYLNNQHHAHTNEEHH